MHSSTALQIWLIGKKPLRLPHAGAGSFEPVGPIHCSIPAVGVEDEGAIVVPCCADNGIAVVAPAQFFKRTSEKVCPKIAALEVIMDPKPRAKGRFAGMTRFFSDDLMCAFADFLPVGNGVKNQLGKVATLSLP